MSPARSSGCRFVLPLAAFLCGCLAAGCSLITRTPPTEEAAAMKQSLANYVTPGMKAAEAQRALQRVGFTVQRKKAESPLNKSEAAAADKLAPQFGEYLEGVRRPALLPAPNPGYRVVLTLEEEQVKDIRVATVMN